MAGIFEKTGHDALASTSRITPPDKSAARYEDGMNRTNYTLDISYQGRPDPVDMVRKQVDREPTADFYQNPVKAMMGGNSPKRDIYASLLNYKFLS
jgi:hypothetical protein